MGLLLLVVVLVLSTVCGFTLAASKKLIKVGIVNLPPAIRIPSANVEDMNVVFSRKRL